MRREGEAVEHAQAGAEPHSPPPRGGAPAIAASPTAAKPASAEPAAAQPAAAAQPSAAPRPRRKRKRRRRETALGRALRRVGVAIAAVALSLYIWLIFHTVRWRYVGREHLEAMMGEPAFIAAVWHGRLAPIAMLRPRGRRAVAMISASRDGALLAQVMSRLGAEAVFGSSRDPRKAGKSKGGASAYARSLTALEDGAILVITPDGPRGPRMRAKPGVSAISASSGCSVLPVAFSAGWALEFSAWDRFLAPLPFSRGAFVFGAPVPAPARGDEAALEAHLSAVEAAMIAATEEADRRVGRRAPTPEPGPSEPHL